MADNVTLDPGAGGAVIATDDDGVAHHQYVKVEFGADNTQTKVTTTTGLPTDPLDRAARDCGKVDVANHDTLGTFDFDTGVGTQNLQAIGLMVPASGGGVVVTGDTANGLDVDVTRVGGTVTVAGTVTSNQGTAGTAWEVIGDVAHDAAGAGINPLAVGGFASAAAPADVSADGDVVQAWHLRNGAQATVVTAAGALIGGDATNGLDVDVTRVQGTVTVGGVAAHDSAVSGNPILNAGEARTTNPTAVANGDVAHLMTDTAGRLVVVNSHVRDRVVNSGRISLTSTTETTLLAAGGVNVFRDLTCLLLSNESATEVRVDIRDATAGTVIMSMDLAAAGGGAVIPFNPPWKQTTANNAWTVQLSAAVSTVYVSANAVENV